MLQCLICASWAGRESRLQLNTSSQHGVLQSRPLPPAETLQLLRGAPGESQNSTGDLHWQYLEHLVAERSSRDPALHTELASALAAAALPLLPPPSPHARPGKRRVAAAVSGSPGERAKSLRKQAKRLFCCYPKEGSHAS